MTADIVRVTLDSDGQLLSADARFDALNAVAGGQAGSPLAISAIAEIARLSRRLGIVISRPAIVASDRDELELWVRAEPRSDTIELRISGWPETALDPGSDFHWETDSTLTLNVLTLDDVQPGAALTGVFELEGDDALIRILSAAGNRDRFDEQPARLRSDGREVRLSGRARIDDSQRFAGFVGTGRFVVPPPATPKPPRPSSTGHGFADRLDRALRTPLQRIVAHADSIGAQSDGPVQAEYVEYAHDIAGAARHLMGLVDDLVDLSAIERPDFRVEDEPIDLADIARRAAGLLAVRAADGQVEIARPDRNERLSGRGELRRALQILVNLIGNAVRYSPPGSTVRIETGHIANGVFVTVADRGKGIAIEDQTRIFEKFGRVDPTEPGGNGLGLYIARRLARAMGGDITVESSPGEGARFTLTLPSA